MRHHLCIHPYRVRDTWADARMIASLSIERRDVLAAIETLLKEAIHPEVRAYLRGLYLDLTKKDLPA